MIFKNKTKSVATEVSVWKQSRCYVFNSSKTGRRELSQTPCTVVYCNTTNCNYESRLCYVCSHFSECGALLFACTCAARLGVEPAEQSGCSAEPNSMAENLYSPTRISTLDLPVSL